MRESQDRPIHVRAGGLIIHDRQVLVTVNRDEFDPIFYLLPGGGQQFGESLRDAVRREVLEETGLEVVVHELAFVREYIAANHEFAEHERNHNVECYFRCTAPEYTFSRSAPLPDTFQTGVAWIAIDDLAHSLIYPKAFRTAIPEYLEFGRTVYLGDVN